jgi:hypothetical protein
MGFLRLSSRDKVALKRNRTVIRTQLTTIVKPPTPPLVRFQGKGPFPASDRNPAPWVHPRSFEGSRSGKDKHTSGPIGIYKSAKLSQKTSTAQYGISEEAYTRKSEMFRWYPVAFILKGGIFCHHHHHSSALPSLISVFRNTRLPIACVLGKRHHPVLPTLTA